MKWNKTNRISLNLFYHLFSWNIKLAMFPFQKFTKLIIEENYYKETLYE